MAKSTVLVSGDQLILPSGNVPVESEAWFQWLDENKSFRFEADIQMDQQLEVSPGNFKAVPHIGSVSFSASKELRHGGREQYWFATRKVNGKFRRAYLGKSGRSLTGEKLRSVALKLAGVDVASLPCSAENFHTSQRCGNGEEKNRVNTSDSAEIAKLKVELEKWKARAIALQKQLKQETERAEAATRWGHEQRKEAEKWRQLAESAGKATTPVVVSDLPGS
jgi:hypothetical protein